MADQPVLECQQCGAVLRVLSDQEAQQVSANPQNFIVYCGPCSKDVMERFDG